MTAVEPTTPTNTPTAGNRSRRDVLCGLMVALVAPGALVAACSDSDSSGSDTPTQGGNPQGNGNNAPGQSLTALADVPDGGGLIVDNPAGGKLVVVRTNGSEVRAYNASCTHMGTIVGAPQDGVSTCPNHGSQFAMSDGSVKKGPATQPLAAVKVKVDGDQVVLV